jgi:hypothetical protein
LDNTNTLTKDVGFIPLADDELTGVKSKWEEFLKTLAPVQ